jgi:Secretion system C-terminal sorting domain
MIRIKISKHIFSVIIICLCLSCYSNLNAQYLIRQSIFGNGGTAVSDSAYNIKGTIGQTLIGVATSSSNYVYSGFWFQENPVVTSVTNGLQNTLPKDYNLSQNYPNPFNPTTIINFSVLKSGMVTIKVYDVLGREVTILVNENKSAGNYRVQFNASKLVSGIYFYRMESGSFSQTKKLLLIK